MKIGDVIRARSVAAVYALGADGDVEVERKITPRKGQRLVLLVLGIESRGDNIDPDVMLNRLGWKFEDDTTAPAPGQEG